MTQPSLKTLATDDRDIVARRFELLATSTNARAAIETQIEKDYHALLAQHKTVLAQLTGKIEFAERIVLAIAEEHPEWFAESATFATTFGSVQCRKTTSHKYADEAHSIRLIENAAAKCEDPAQKARLLGLVRVKKELNIEAVECLGEKELAKLQIVRVKNRSLTIKLAKPAAAKKPRGKKSEEAPAMADAA